MFFKYKSRSSVLIQPVFVAEESLLAVSSSSTMEGSASVRKSLSGTLVPVTVTTMAMIQQPEENDKGKLKRKVLDEEEYIEVVKGQLFVVDVASSDNITAVLC